MKIQVAFPVAGMQHGGLTNLFLLKTETEADVRNNGFLYRNKDWGTDRHQTSDTGEATA